jgi:competence protein ComEC
LRYQLFVESLKVPNLPYFEKIEVVGVIVEPPEIREKYQRLVFKSSGLEKKFLIFTSPYQNFDFGDEIKVFGNLEPLDETKKYFLKDKILGIFYFPKIELLSKSKNFSIFSSFLSRVYNLKKFLENSVDENFQFPYSFLLKAITLGEKEEMPSSLKDILNNSGLRHITAISGLHITILSAILYDFLLSIGFWRHHSFYFSTIFIFAYLAMLGWQISALRAGIFGLLFGFSQIIGREILLERMIFYTAAFLLFLNPLLLTEDISFQLSFASILGINYFSSFFREILNFSKNKIYHSFLNTFSMSLGALIFSGPLLFYHFGKLPVAALITNLLVIPILPYLLSLSFLFFLFALIFPSLSRIFSLICFPFLFFIVFVAKFFSENFPLIELKISVFQLFISYFFLFLAAFKIKQEKRLKFLQLPF